jgi:hypothetical protein
MLAIEPWFLGTGILLGVVGYLAQRSPGGRTRWLWLVGAGFVVAFASAATELKIA